MCTLTTMLYTFRFSCSGLLLLQFIHRTDCAVCFGIFYSLIQKKKKIQKKFPLSLMKHFYIRELNKKKKIVWISTRYNTSAREREWETHKISRSFQSAFYQLKYCCSRMYSSHALSHIKCSKKKKKFPPSRRFFFYGPGEKLRAHI